MKVLKAPEEFTPWGCPVIFLAGGISNCPNWQEEATDFIQKNFGYKDFVLVNPRRDDFNMADPSMSIAQIHWEHKMLELADAVFFWFPKDTLCPITLYELGVYTNVKKDLIIGCDPEYKRRIDVIEQTSLRRPEITVQPCFDCFLSKIRNFINTNV